MDPRTKTATVADTDGNEVSVTVKRLTQGDYFVFMDLMAQSKDSAGVYRARVEFLLKRGIESWSLTDDQERELRRDNAVIPTLDVALVENIIDEIKAFNPAIFPDGRRVTGEAALGYLASDGDITKERAVEVLTALRHDRPTRPAAE